MKLGISSASFFNQVATEDCFDMLRNMGVDCTEVFFNTYSEYEPSFVDKLVAKKGNIKVHSVHALGTQFEPELFNINDRVKNDAIKILRKVLQAAQSLNAQYYTFHGPLKLKRIPYNIDFDSYCKKLNYIIAICKEYGIKLAYENVHYSYYNNPMFFESIKHRCPDLYATFDIKHAYQSGYDYKEYLKFVGDRLAVLHICDVKLDNSTELPFNGIVDFEGVFFEIKKYKPDAVILLELYSNNYTSLNQVKETFVLLNTKLQEVENKLLQFDQRIL